jgi:aldehyde:ferredoxin oxidoreductase
LTETPAPTGPAKGLVCQLDKMLDAYYREQGWSENGIPKKEVLDRLGLV